MASTDLKLESSGTLQRPGPIGRVARILFGVFCAWYVTELFGVKGDLFSLLGAYGLIHDAMVETPSLAHALWFWEVYIFSHLGLSFLRSAILATPGCEMRSIHDLYSRLSGKPTKEHYCPIGPLSSIDAWEGSC